MKKDETGQGPFPSMPVFWLGALGLAAGLAVWSHHLGLTTGQGFLACFGFILAYISLWIRVHWRD